jgi:hypothetical protein
MQNNNDQAPLFYEDIMDAINKMVNGNPKGLSLKQIAMDLWPARNPDTARSTLSRALNEENTEQNLNPMEIIKTMHITERPEDIIFYICDEFGYERPVKKDKERFEKVIKKQVKGIQDQVMFLSRQISQLEKMKES